MKHLGFNVSFIRWVTFFYSEKSICTQQNIMAAEYGSSREKVFAVFKFPVRILIHVSQLRAGGPVIPGLTLSGQSQTRSEHAPGCYGNLVYYGDEYYFYFMGGHA